MITFGNVVTCLANRHVITPFRIEADARVSAVSTVEPYDPAAGTNTVRVGYVSQYAALDPALRSGNFVLATDLSKAAIPSEPWANIACVPDTDDIEGVVVQLEALLGRAAKPALRERLFTLLLSDDEVGGLADVVAELVGNPVVVADAAFRVLADSHGSAGAVPSLSEFESVDPTDNVVVGADGVRRLVVRLRYEGALVGYLVAVERFSRLGSCDKDTYSLCARVLAKQLSAEKHRAAAARSHVSRETELLADLARGRVRTEADFRERLAGTALRGAGVFRTVCFDRRFADAADEAETEAMRARVDSLLPGSYAFALDGWIVAVVCDADETGFEAQVAIVTDAEGLRAGVSDPFTDLFELAHHVEAAEKAVRLAESTGCPERVCPYARFRTWDLFSRVEPGQLERFCDPGVLRLAADDEASGDGLFDTLDAFLVHGCSVTETARACYIHRNTVGYRVSQIESRYGLDLSDPGRRSDYLVSCRIVRYLRALRAPGSATGLPARLFRNK